jgi:Bacterial membrane protein YfhO
VPPSGASSRDTIHRLGGESFTSDQAILAVERFQGFILGIAFWDPLVMGGFPIAADPQAMSWYPISTLFSALGSWNGFVLSAYVLASCFTYGYVYTLTRSRLAAAVSGTVYGMSGFMMAHLGHTSMLHAAAWMPLLVWAVEGLVGGFKMFWLVVGAVAVACSVLSGHSQMSVYALSLGGLYTVARCGYAPSGRGRFCALYAAIVILGLGLASLQIIPTAELARLSLRSSLSFTDFVSYSLPFHQSIEIVFPYLFGTHAPNAVYAVPYFGEWNLTEVTGYMGLLTLMLAVVGALVDFKRAITCFWIAVALVAFLLVFGDLTPLSRVTYYLPGINKFRAQARHFIEVTLAVSVLAGLGVAAIKNQVVTAKHVVVALAALGTTALFSLGVILWRAGTLKELATAKGMAALSVLPWSNPAVGIPLGIVVAGTLILVFWVRRPASALRILLLLVCLVVDLGSFGWFCEWRFASLLPDWSRPPDLARVYRASLDATPQRIAPVRGVLGSREEVPPNLNRLWGVSSVSGYGPLLLSRISEALSMPPHGEITGFWYRPEHRAFDVLGVSHVFVPLSAFGPLTGKSPGISWPHDDISLRLGTACGASQRSSRLRLPVSAKATALAMVSFLACASAILDDTETVSVVVTDSQEQAYTYSFRAGRDTSEWALECPDVAREIRHRLAPVFSSFPITRPGSTCQGHRYVGTLGFGKELDVKVLEFTWTGPPAALIGIEKIALHNEITGVSYPVSPMAEFLSDSERWRLVREIEGTRVYENARAMPRAWLVPETVTLKPDEVLVALKTSRLPDGRPFDPSRTGLVEEPLEVKGDADATAEAVVQRVTDTVVEVLTRSSTISFLVMSDVYYPGWSVTVDDAPSRLYQADYVLRGVVVPAGEHLVRFKFTPRTFYAGLGISVLCAAVTIGISAFGILKERRRTDNSRETANAVER